MKKISSFYKTKEIMDKKLLLILCAISAFKCQEISITNRSQYEKKTITDETLKKLFEKLKQFIGHDEGFKYQHFLTNTSLIFINATVRDLHVIDPSAYSVSEAHADMEYLQFDVNIEYPTLNITGNYEMQAENEMLNLVGNGTFSMNIKNPTLTVGWRFNLTKNETIEIEYFDLNYIFSEIKVNITNLGGDEEVSQTLNDLINIALPEMINVTKGDVEKVVNQWVQYYSLFLLTGMTVDEFIEHVYQIIDL